MFIFNSRFHDHKVTKDGEVIAEFKPTPEPDFKAGVMPTHGVFTTPDRGVAKALLALGKKQGIALAPGSDDPDAEPAAAQPGSEDKGKK